MKRDKKEEEGWCILLHICVVKILQMLVSECRTTRNDLPVGVAFSRQNLPSWSGVAITTGD